MKAAGSTTPFDLLAADTRSVATAMALLWSWHTRANILATVHTLGLRRVSGAAFTLESIKLAIEELREHGLLLLAANRNGYMRLHGRAGNALYRQLLDNHSPYDLRGALHGALGLSEQRDRGGYWGILDSSTMVAVLRLALLGGSEEQQLVALCRKMQGVSNEIFDSAVLDDFDPDLYQRITTPWRWDIARNAVERLCEYWDDRLLPVCEWAGAMAQDKAQKVAPRLRVALAEMALGAGRRQQVEQLLSGLDGGQVDALQAALCVQAGEWPAAQQGFENALKRLQTESGVRKRLLPPSLAWFYPLSLLAQGTPAGLARALKFCLGESGKRDPSPEYGWGIWAHAISVRLGDAQLRRHVFDSPPLRTSQASLELLWRLLLAAWLGPATVRDKNGTSGWESDWRALDATLTRCGMEWLHTQAANAVAVLRGEPATPGFFIGQPLERWQEVLLALQALADEPQHESTPDATRLLWLIDADAQGRLHAVQPYEQKIGKRGPGKPKAASLGKIAAGRNLSPWDARVARSIRKDRYAAAGHRMDRVQAIAALVGHPCVAFADQPETLIELSEGTPELELTREGDSIRLAVWPLLQEEPQFGHTPELAEFQPVHLVTLVRDSAQRARLIRLNPAQRRAAQLLGNGLRIPASQQAQIDAALGALTRHFQVHAEDDATTAGSARAVESDSRIRAELAPNGTDLALRLVVTPLGSDGPRLDPGRGRARIQAAVSGENIGARRDLAAERANLEAVFDALPFLEEMRNPGDTLEWLLDDPEQALGCVETLPALACVSGIDWPKGKRVKVLGADTAQLRVSVNSDRNWFQLDGGIDIEEARVLAFADLLRAAAGSSRFIPIGDGTYIALSRELKQRLADLDAVAEQDRSGLRISRMAASWMEQSLRGSELSADADFSAAIERLRAAEQSESALPGALQAQLRPYQEDGYRWAMRLADAGLGACLADDMGLGKTLQALAVMLARAARGATLVIAPTSVCGNWLAEAARFAPSLRMIDYRAGDRMAILETAGAMDVVVASYALLLRDQEAFAARGWHTLVADEAQSVKNATAKRSQALFELQADFRLALSGTPVENRLAELWSIMHLCNPGLLGNWSRFNARFATPIERQRDRNARHTLRRLIAPFLLRRTKTEVLDELPPRTELVLPLQPEADEAAHYEALRREALAQSESLGGTSGQSRINILAQLTRLRRAACDPRLGGSGFGNAGIKVQSFATLVEELIANGHKALVFSQFVDFLSLLREPLDAAGIRYQYLDGATPAAERDRRVAAFQAGDGDLFLISLKAGGFGLNLTAADYVVITDPWWNPAAEDQALGRAHRMGQQRPVTVYRLVTQGTVEERIVALHADKRSLAESILDGADTLAPTSTEELIELLRG
jgi:superfamily II DNA or RNA helicase